MDTKRSSEVGSRKVIWRVSIRDIEAKDSHNKMPCEDRVCSVGEEVVWWDNGKHLEEIN